MSLYETLLTEKKEGRVGLIVINRPDRRNALSGQALKELEEAFAAFEADEEVGAIVVTGAGDKAFCAGADLEEGFDAAAGVEGPLKAGQKLFDRIEACPKPVVAAVNGYAFGGGCELMMACDISVASENVQVGQPEIGRGVVPGWGATQRLPRLVGKQRAMSLMLQGNRIKAQEAERIGLIAKVVGRGEALDEALKLAQKLAAAPAHCSAGVKRAVLTGLREGAEKGLAAEAAAFVEAFDRLPKDGKA